VHQVGKKKKDYHCVLLLPDTTEMCKMWEDTKILCKDPQYRIWLKSVERFARRDMAHLTYNKSHRISYTVLNECIRRKFSFHLRLQFPFDKLSGASIAYYAHNGSHKYA